MPPLNALTMIPMILSGVIGLFGCTSEDPGLSKETTPITLNTQESNAHFRENTLDENQVRNRTVAYLDALRINDLATAYLMEAGSLDGTLTPLAFRQTVIPHNGALMDYEIISIIIDIDEANVEANVSYQLPGLRKPYKTQKQMKWINHDGVLYLTSTAPNIKD
jgi:hypothetical protein